MSGYDCFCQVRESQGQLPVILMTGFGYDPGHSIVKARQQGLESRCCTSRSASISCSTKSKRAVNHHGAVIVNQGDAAGTTAPAPSPSSTAP